MRLARGECSSTNDCTPAYTHRIKLQLASSTLEGTLFTYSPILNIIALTTSSSTTTAQQADYRIVPVSAVQNVIVLAPAEGEPTPIGRVDTAKLKQREEERVRKLVEQEAKKGKGVSVEGQKLFDALDRMYVALVVRRLKTSRTNVLISWDIGTLRAGMVRISSSLMR